MIRNFILTYFTVLMVITADYVSKHYALNSELFVKNSGVMMELLSHLPLVVKSVYLATIGIGLFVIYLLLISYFRFKTKRFLLGISMLFGGVLGNVFDRIFYGYVIDFIPLPGQVMINLADLFQLVGAFLVIISWKQELDFHLPLENKRMIKFLNQKEQVRFVAHFFLLVFCACLLIFGFSYVFIKYTLIDARMAPEANINAYLDSYVMMFISFIPFIALFVFVVAYIIASRMFGPIYSIENYLNDTLQGKAYAFKLREGDSFKTLESTLNKINKSFNDT